MGPLTAKIDANEASRIVFSRPVTTDEARKYLWLTMRSPDALRPDPAERPQAGRQQKFLVKKDLDLLLSMQHGLDREYVKLLQSPMGANGGPGVLVSNAPVGLPKWVPPDVQDRIFTGSLPNGVTRFPGLKPWGDIVVWLSKGSYTNIQVYQEYPEDIDFYLKITENDGHEARLLHQVYTGFNRDMRYFVEEKRLSPEMARDEIRRINDEIFKLVLEASVSILSNGAAISALGNSIRSSSGTVLATAERTKFAAPKASSALVQEVKVSEEEYRAALSRAFPSHQLDPIARTVDEIGQRAAERVSNDPKFLQALLKKDWKTAGNLFHDAAKQETRAVTPGTLPQGWTITAEETIQAGKGGSRLDVFLRGPKGERIEFDWKTTGSSALSSGARKEMVKHAGQIVINVGGTVTKQESRSWVDYVRSYFPSVNW
jgi:hypothetical protein